MTTTTMSPIEMYTAGMITFVEMCDMLADQEAKEAGKNIVVLDPAGWGAPVPSKVEIEWLNTTIESLESELAEYSNFAWNTPGRVFRHDTLIRLVARRNRLVA